MVAGRMLVCLLDVSFDVALCGIFILEVRRDEYEHPFTDCLVVCCSLFDLLFLVCLSLQVTHNSIPFIGMDEEKKSMKR